MTLFREMKSYNLDEYSETASMALWCEGDIGEEERKTGRDCDQQKPESP